MAVPPFKLNRWINIDLAVSKSGKETLYVDGITELGNPFDLFRSVSINKQNGNSYTLTENEMDDKDFEF